MTQLIENVERWVFDRNLHTGCPKKQMCKTMEELGELASSINKGNLSGIMDGVGDVAVTLIAICEQNGVKFEDCLALAYNEIKDRKGKLIDGTFVKDADIIR